MLPKRAKVPLAAHGDEAEAVMVGQQRGDDLARSVRRFDQPGGRDTRARACSPGDLVHHAGGEVLVGARVHQVEQPRQRQRQQQMLPKRAKVPLAAHGDEAEAVMVGQQRGDDLARSVRRFDQPGGGSAAAVAAAAVADCCFC
ncbi:hypothetical protein OsI_22700 [Oryza sativa Indica Group]|uniref:Uncharacterized protein n=1 Tax=Oryza sativa subsp. indica TaxID=39946 RepID=B8B126_ORYSI|nr:hypothetical protein OsI_22700 [Oryza sativa Indica Group]